MLGGGAALHHRAAWEHQTLRQCSPSCPALPFHLSLFPSVLHPLFAFQSLHLTSLPFILCLFPSFSFYPTPFIFQPCPSIYLASVLSFTLLYVPFIFLIISSFLSFSCVFPSSSFSSPPSCPACTIYLSSLPSSILFSVPIISIIFFPYFHPLTLPFILFLFTHFLSSSSHVWSFLPCLVFSCFSFALSLVLSLLLLSLPYIFLSTRFLSSSLLPSYLFFLPLILFIILYLNIFSLPFILFLSSYLSFHHSYHRLHLPFILFILRSAF